MPPLRALARQEDGWLDIPWCPLTRPREGVASSVVRDGCALMTALAPCGGGGRVVEWQGAGVMLDDGPWPMTSVASGLSLLATIEKVKCSPSAHVLLLCPGFSDEIAVQPKQRMGRR